MTDLAAENQKRNEHDVGQAEVIAGDEIASLDFSVEPRQSLAREGLEVVRRLGNGANSVLEERESVGKAETVCHWHRDREFSLECTMIFRSPFPDVTLPDLTLTEFVLRRAGELAGRPAMIDGLSGRELTFGQLAESIRRAAAGLSRRGFKKGDVFAIYSPNVPEYGVVFHAVAILGGINTTINPLYTAGELAHQLNDSGAKYLLTVEMFLDKAKEAAAQSGVEEVFVFGEAEGATPFAALLDSDGDPRERNAQFSRATRTVPRHRARSMRSLRQGRGDR